MLTQRRGHPPRRAEGHEPKARDLLAQVQEQARQLLVATRLVDRAMELGVEPEVRPQVAVPDRAPHGRQHRIEGAEVSRADMAGRQTGPQRLERLEHVEGVSHFLLSDRTHAGTAAGVDFHQTFGGQKTERLPNWRTTAPDPATDLLLHQTLPGLQIPLEDTALQMPAHPIDRIAGPLPSRAPRAAAHGHGNCRLFPSLSLGMSRGKFGGTREASHTSRVAPPQGEGCGRGRGCCRATDVCPVDGGALLHHDAACGACRARPIVGRGRLGRGIATRWRHAVESESRSMGGGCRSFTSLIDTLRRSRARDQAPCC